MIVFDLDCADCGGRFESWFASGVEHDRLADLGLLACAVCGSANVRKAPMAPSVPRKEASVPLASIASLQSEIISQSRWVGNEFAATARAIHSGKQAAERIHGQATLGEARDLLDEGVPVLSLPLLMVPPNQVN
ncbi:MAG: DUF1178 family protein [Sphingomicrobium sp.]